MDALPWILLCLVIALWCLGIPPLVVLHTLQNVTR